LRANNWELKAYILRKKELFAEKGVIIIPNKYIEGER